MSIYHADRATPEVLEQVQRLLAPVCEALLGEQGRLVAGILPLHRLASDLPPRGWKFVMRREQVIPAGSYFIAGQDWPVRAVCHLGPGGGDSRNTASWLPSAAWLPSTAWTLPGWSLAGLVLLVSDFGPEANDRPGLWPALEAATSTILAGGYAGRLP